MHKINLAQKLSLFDDYWEEGEIIIVLRGVDHRPVADEEVQVLLFEPASTLNTENELTAKNLLRV